MIEGNGHRQLETGGAPERTSVRTPSKGRRYIVLGVLVSLVASALVGGYIRDRGWVRVSSVETLDAREVLYLPAYRVFVVANANSPVALLAISPHLGERLLYCRRARTFQDASGDSFNRFGRYLLGPSPRGMDRIAVRIKGDDVNVKPAVVNPGTARSAQADRPQGQPCDPRGAEGAPGFFTEGG
jgi:hypothetical protein